MHTVNNTGAGKPTPLIWPGYMLSYITPAIPIRVHSKEPPHTLHLPHTCAPVLTQHTLTPHHLYQLTLYTFYRINAAKILNETYEDAKGRQPVEPHWASPPIPIPSTNHSCQITGQYPPQPLSQHTHLPSHPLRAQNRSNTPPTRPVLTATRVTTSHTKGNYNKPTSRLHHAPPIVETLAPSGYI